MCESIQILSCSLTSAEEIRAFNWVWIFTQLMRILVCISQRSRKRQHKVWKKHSVMLVNQFQTSMVSWITLRHIWKKANRSLRRKLLRRCCNSAVLIDQKLCVHQCNCTQPVKKVDVVQKMQKDTSPCWILSSKSVSHLFSLLQFSRTKQYLSRRCQTWTDRFQLNFKESDSNLQMMQLPRLYLTWGRGVWIFWKRLKWKKSTLITANRK